jgi:hypothetical protein
MAKEQNQTRRIMAAVLRYKRNKRLPNILAPGSAPAAEGVAGTAGTVVGPIAAGAAPAVEAPVGKLDKDAIKDLLGSKRFKRGAGGFVGYMVLQGLLRTILQGAQQLQETGLAGGQMEAQMEAASPEAARQMALQPITRAQRDHALMMLMQQMGGSGNGRAPMLARGEVLT